jgi:mitotic spindle assembly checkpoint protein MAD2
MAHKSIHRLVLVISSAETGLTLERWQFNIQLEEECEEEEKETIKENRSSKPATIKSEKEIQNEIQAVIRQITASVTFLPILEHDCTFDVLVYTTKDVKPSSKWEESDAKLIVNGQNIRLRSFNTSIHRVDTMVSYLLGGDSMIGFS